MDTEEIVRQAMNTPDREERLKLLDRGYMGFHLKRFVKDPSLDNLVDLFEWTYYSYSKPQFDFSNVFQNKLRGPTGEIDVQRHHVRGALAVVASEVTDSYDVYLKIFESIEEGSVPGGLRHNNILRRFESVIKAEVLGDKYDYGRRPIFFSQQPEYILPHQKGTAYL